MNENHKKENCLICDNKHTLQMILKSPFLCWLFISLLFSGCKEELGPPTIDPNMDPFEVTTENLVAPAKVGIKPNFSTASQYKWDFQGAYERYDTEKKEYSYKLEPDTIIYDQPGTYNVSLTYYMGNEVANTRTVTKEIKVGKPKPRIDITAIKLSPGNEIMFTATNYWNNPSFNTTFNWEVDGAVKTQTPNMSTVFATAGIKMIKLTVFDGEDTFVVENKLDIKDPTPETQSKTIYYADMVSGYIYGKIVPVDESKFTENDLAPRKVCAIPTNTYILGMGVSGNGLIISDAGVKVAGAVGTDTDGEIYQLDITKLASAKSVIVKKGTFNGTNDCVKPYASTISGDYIYTASRLYNLFKISLLSNNEDFETAASPIRLTNSAGANIVSIQGGVQIEGNYAYISCYSHSLPISGIWKHDMATGKSTKTVADIAPSTPISAFVVDGNTVYYATNPTSATGTAGNSEIVKCDLDGGNKVVIASYQSLSVVPSAAEIIGIRSLVLDKEGGILYWCVRNGGGIFGTPDGSGIMSWKTDGSAAPRMLVPGVVSVSMALDQTLR